MKSYASTQSERKERSRSDHDEQEVAEELNLMSKIEKLNLGGSKRHQRYTTTEGQREEKREIKVVTGWMT